MADSTGTLDVCIRIALLAVLAVSIGARASAQDRAIQPYGMVPAGSDPSHGASMTDLATPSAVDQPDAAASSSRGEALIAPLPMIDPTIGNGGALVLGYLFRTDASDRVTPPSAVAIAGMATDNGSWGGMAAAQLHFRHDRFRILAVGGYANVNYEFFGIGQDAGSSNRSIPLEQRGTVALGEGLVLLGAKWYVGARYQFMKMNVRVDQSGLPDTAPAFPARDVELETAALGPRIQHDNRDNPFYPRTGSLFNVVTGFYGESLGGNRSYQSYQAWFSDYLPLSSRQVLAWRVAACDTEGDVPFYDLCQLGKSQDLRGYVIGQYRDRAMVAAQAECRVELWKFLGATGFIGGGAVAPAFDQVKWNDVLPGGGVGLRVTVAKRNHVNIRADYAWGRDSSAFYVGVGEAF